jgi:hypothetical protein
MSGSFQDEAWKPVAGATDKKTFGTDAKSSRTAVTVFISCGRG